MSASVTRAVARQQRQLVARVSKRNASSAAETASNAANTVKEATGNATGKAQEGLSRVTSSAGAAASKAGSAAANMVGGIGGRAGRLIGFVQSLVPPTIYYSKVGLELGKIMFQGQKMNPPTGAHFQQYSQQLLKYARNPSAVTSAAESASQKASSAAQNAAQKVAENPETAMNSLRNINSAQMAAGAVVLAEVLGFFSVGEILGRFKIVGYRSKSFHDEGPIGH